MNIFCFILFTALKLISSQISEINIQTQDKIHNTLDNSYQIYKLEIQNPPQFLYCLLESLNPEGQVIIMINEGD